MASRAVYMKGYRATVKQRSNWREKMLFREGSEAMRQAAIKLFKGIGPGEMTGYTAMEIMRELSVGQQ